MRNSNSPPSWQPREGGGPPPGGPEEFARYREMKAMPAKQRNFMQMAQNVVGRAMPQQPQRQTAPDWSQGQRMQWGAPTQAPPQMPQQPGAAPPQAPPQMPAQAAPQGNRFQPAGAAGIGRAARGMYDRARVNALRGGGQVQQ